jgi:hypothetical protein
MKYEFWISVLSSSLSLCESDTSAAECRFLKFFMMKIASKERYLTFVPMLVN